ncbi:hypothetical protein C8R47DRAFT_1073641 [Mycena vitilis]|nr:hypothetical protein C8R47DRAFT_1073641 [Mycena vitilis]
MSSTVFAGRYVPGKISKDWPYDLLKNPGISITIILYDHCLTFKDEVTFVWFNTKAEIRDKVGFLVNRYLTEAIGIYVAYLVWAGPLPIRYESQSTPINFLITLSVHPDRDLIIRRVYAFWDRRLLIKRILLAAFSVEIILAFIFAVVSAVEINKHSMNVFNPLVNMCVFTRKPWALKFTMGALTLFDFFIIIMTVLNAYHRPHTKQADVITSLQHDGAKMFAVMFGKPFPPPADIWLGDVRYRQFEDANSGRTSPSHSPHGQFLGILRMKQGSPFLHTLADCCKYIHVAFVTSLVALNIKSFLVLPAVHPPIKYNGFSWTMIHPSGAEALDS